MDLSAMSDDQLLALYSQEKAKQPVDAPEWGPGAKRLPNGAIVTYDGPKGRMMIRQPAGTAGGFDGTSDSQVYAKKLAEGRAAMDLKKLENANAAEQQAYDNETTANRAGQVLDDGAPTGAFAEQRIGLGKTVGRVPILNMLPGVPNEKQTDNLQSIRALGNQGALGQVGQLKGPLSDRDVAFLKTLQYSADATPDYNRRVVEAQKWVARRQAGYSAALRRWTQVLGSPSAANAKGATFDQFWGSYAAEKLPPPGVGSGAKPAVAGRPVATKPPPGSGMTDAQLKKSLGL